MAAVDRNKLRESIGALRKKLGTSPSLISGTRDLSYRRLADEITARAKPDKPIHGSTVKKWEQGKGSPDAWVLLALAEIAGTTAERFVTGAWLAVELPANDAGLTRYHGTEADDAEANRKGA